MEAQVATTVMMVVGRSKIVATEHLSLFTMCFENVNWIGIGRGRNTNEPWNQNKIYENMETPKIDHHHTRAGPQSRPPPPPFILHFSLYIVLVPFLRLSLHSFTFTREFAQ